MKERIQKLLVTLGYTASRLADEIQVQRSGISHILSGRNQPSYDFMVRLLNRFPEINARWLLTGQGDMFSNDTDGAKSDYQSTPEQKKLTKNSLHMNETKYSEINPDKVTNVNLTRTVLLLKSDGTFELFEHDRTQ